MKLIYREYLSDMHNITLKVWLSALILFLFGCEAKQSDLIKRVAPNQDPFPSTYQIKSPDPFMIVNTSILDGVGNLLTNTDLLIENGKIKEIGVGLPTKNYRLVTELTFG